MTHFLSQKRPANFPAFLQEVSQREPLAQHERDVDEALFVKHFGDDYSGLESLELKHLQGLPYVNPLKRAGLQYKCPVPVELGNNFLSCDRMSV